MLIYYVIFLLAAICGFLETINIRAKERHLLVFIMFLTLSVFAGMRYQVGYDYSTYEEIFQLSDQVKNYSFINTGIPELHGEPGFLFVNFLFQKLHLPFTFLILFFAFLSMTLLYKVQIRYKAPILAGLLIYISRFYLIRDMGQFRSSLAMLLLLYGTVDLYKGKTGRYFLLVLLGALFHSVALLGLLFYFFNKIQFNNKKVYGFLLIAFSIGAINWIALGLPLFQLILPQTIFATYFLWERFAFTLGLLNPVLIAQVGVSLIFWHNRLKLSKKVPYFEIIFKAYFFSTLILATFNRIGVVAGRTSTVYATFEIIIVPSFMLLIKEKYMVYILIFLYAAAIFTLNLLKDPDLFIPYKTFLF